MKQIFVLNVFSMEVKCANVSVLEFFLGVAVTPGGNVSIIPPQVTKPGIGTSEEGRNCICPWALEAPKMVHFLPGKASIFPLAPTPAPLLATTRVGANDTPSSFRATSSPTLPAHVRARPDPARR